MLFIEYPKCSTCIKAKKFLIEHNVSIEDRDIKLNNPNVEEIKKFHELSGLDIDKIFNTSGLLYKELGLKEKLKSLSYEEKIKLLASNGMLIKRPILVSKSKALFGFKEDKYLELIKE